MVDIKAFFNYDEVPLFACDPKGHVLAPTGSKFIMDVSKGADDDKRFATLGVCVTGEVLWIGPQDDAPVYDIIPPITLDGPWKNLRPANRAITGYFESYFN